MTLGELQYLITVNDKTDDGIRKSEGKIKKAEKQLTAFGIARAQMVMDFAKKAASTAVNAFKNTVKSAVSAYADYEQLVGGVETLFKDSAIKVQKYAAQAYKTVGISANEYMENVTSFSASLLQSLGGDTSKAADVADMAMKDMADNANKMGSSMESIQNAYQGFAKQNYTMLDNLKLGYGGTKTEMERLLKDAEKLTGKKYNLNNLSDVYEAIHAIQQEMGITGTTALEAEKTISGSMNMTKAAWKDLLTAIGSGRDVKKATKNFTQSLKQTLKNIVPVVKTSIKGLFEAVKAAMPDIKEALGDIWKSIKQSLPKNNIFSKLAEKVEDAMGFVRLLTDMINDFPGTMKKLEGSDSPWLKGFAKLAELAELLITKINEGVGETGSLFLGTVKGIGEFIAEALKQFSDWLKKDGNVELLAGYISEFITALVTAISQAAGPIVEALISILNDPKFQQAIWDLLGTFLDMLGKLITDGPDAMKAALAAYGTYKGIKIAKTVGLLSGGSAASGLGTAIANGGSAVLSALGKVFSSTGLKVAGGAGAFLYTLLKPQDNEGTDEGPGKVIEAAKMKGYAAARKQLERGHFLELDEKAVEVINTWAREKVYMANMDDPETAKYYTDMLIEDLKKLGYEEKGTPSFEVTESQRTVLETLYDDLKKNRNNPTEAAESEKVARLLFGNDELLNSIINKMYETGFKGEDLPKDWFKVPAELEFPEDESTKIAEDIGPVSIPGKIDFGNIDDYITLFNGKGQAKGNWNVPYDNYPSLLHRGEMVLTKSQARKLRDGEMGNVGISGDALASAVEAAMSRVYVMLSGEKVGDLTTRRIKKNINASSYARMRALGG